MSLVDGSKLVWHENQQSVSQVFHFVWVRESLALLLRLYRITFSLKEGHMDLGLMATLLLKIF